MYKKHHFFISVLLCYSVFFWYAASFCDSDYYYDSQTNKHYLDFKSDSKYKLQSLPEMIQDHVNVRVIHDYTWDFPTHTRSSNEPTGFEDFKDAWKNIGKGIWQGIKSSGKRVAALGKKIVKTPGKILDKIGDGIETTVNWLEDEETVERQPSFNKYKDEIAQSILELEQYPFDTVQQRYTERLEVFNHAENDPIVYEKTYSIPTALGSYMQENALHAKSFAKCHGNIIQHRLHQEILEILTTNYEINKIFSEHQENPLFTDLVVEGADLARQLNTQGDIVRGFKIADYCRWLNEAEYPRLAMIIKQVGAVVVGAVEGGANIVKNTCHMIRHPIETGENLIILGNEVGKFLLHGMVELNDLAQHVGFDGACNEIGYFPVYNKDREDTFAPYELQNPDFINDVQTLKAYYNQASEEFAKLPTEEKTQKIVAFAFELYFTGKFLKQVGKAKSAAIKHIAKPSINALSTKLELFSNKAISKTCNRIARTCKTVENFVQRNVSRSEHYCEWVMDEAGTWKEVINVKAIPSLEVPASAGGHLVSTNAMPPRITSITKNFNDVQKSITKNLLKERVEAIEFVKNAISRETPNLLTGAAQQAITAVTNVTNTNQAEMEMLRLFVAEKKCEDWRENSNRYLKIKIEHIFTIDPKSTNQIKGFHHDFLGILEEKGVITLENLKIGEFGEYMADVIWNGTKTAKTFFPKHWTRTQVLESIIEAYENFKATGIKKGPELDGKYHIKSKTNSGMEIEMYIDNKCNIVTAYPVIEN
ncbi:MAG: EndoU domain-containing protein [Candidatus Babeliales bacterium]